MALLKRILKDAWMGAGYYSLWKEEGFSKYYYVGTTLEEAEKNAETMHLPKPILVSEEHISMAEDSLKNFYKVFRNFQLGGK